MHIPLQAKAGASMGADINYASPSVQFTSDVNNHLFYRKDARNYINVLGADQLNTLQNTSLLDIYLIKDNVIEPHYHQNAAELVYCISGAATVSILNPATKQLLHYPITAGQVANVPRAWWHYEVATTDNTHLLAIFDAPNPEVILGSDLLTMTPASIMAHTYCMDEDKWKQATAPVQPGMIIGPPVGCGMNGGPYVQAQPFPQPFAYGYYGYPVNNKPSYTFYTQ